MINFNNPHFTGKEIQYIKKAIKSGKISGNGKFTQQCQNFFEQKYHFGKSYLTASCTDALEMAAILCNIEPEDEVIIPSFTFVSTALPFVRMGAKIIFADSQADHPNIDARKIETLITKKTKVIVPVHYAGIACDMGKIMNLALKHNLMVIEDAAHGIDAYYISPCSQEKKAIGSIGHFSAFSFHETKNIVTGEGGMLVVNEDRFLQRAEIIWEKGTNRTEFIRGEVDKYGWVDVGSSFLPSEITAAFLFAQIEMLDEIQKKRVALWQNYYNLLEPLSAKGCFSIPVIPYFSTNNAHIFYIVCNSPEERIKLIDTLKSKGITASFHYQSLHKSKYYYEKHDGRELPNCDRFSECLVRLPLYYDLSGEKIKYICREINNFFK